jgi:hypothetical protein
MENNTTKCLVVYYDDGVIVEYLTEEQIKEYSSNHKDIVRFDMNDFQLYSPVTNSWEVVTDGR